MFWPQRKHWSRHALLFWDMKWACFAANIVHAENHRQTGQMEPHHHITCPIDVWLREFNLEIIITDAV